LPLFVFATGLPRMSDQEGSSGSDSDLRFADIASFRALRQHLDLARSPDVSEAPSKSECCVGSVAAGNPPSLRYPLAEEHVAPSVLNGDRHHLQILDPVSSTPLGPPTKPPLLQNLMDLPYCTPAPPRGEPSCLEESKNTAVVAVRQKERKRAGQQPRLRGASRSPLWCDIFLHDQMLSQQFNVGRKLIGKDGCNTRGIFQATGCKIYVCDHGPKPCKAPIKHIRPHGVMIAITSDQGEFTNFRTSFRMVVELVVQVSNQFETFCRGQGVPATKEGLFWVGNATREAVTCLGHLLDGISIADDALHCFGPTQYTKSQASGFVAERAPIPIGLEEKAYVDRDLMLAAVARNGGHLAHAAKELQADHEIVLQAVETTPGAVVHAATHLQADRPFMLEAVKRRVRVLQYVSEELRSDGEFILQAARGNAVALSYASEELRADRKFILEAVRRDAHALITWASLCDDRDFMLEAVKTNGKALLYASPNMRADRDFIQQAIKSNRAALHYVP